MSGAIRPFEIATLDQPESDRGKISLTCDVRGGVLALGGKVAAERSADRAGGPIHGHESRRGGGLHTGKRPRTINHRFIEARLLTSIVPVQLWAHLREQHAVRIDAEIGRAELTRGGDKDATRHQHQHRQRDLYHHERSRKPRRMRDIAAVTGFERGIQVDARGANRGKHREEESAEHGGGDRDSDHAPIGREVERHRVAVR